MNDIARAILSKNHHLVLATVSPSGAPYAVPVHFAFDEHSIYWVSNNEAVHSTNIAGDNRVSLVVFDSYQTGTEPGERGAVYVSSHARELTGDEESVARGVYFERYPDRNIEKYNEWSIYGVPIGAVNDKKSRDAMVYFVNESGRQ